MPDIKKVIQRIYEFDFKNKDLVSGEEMVNTSSGNEFINAFKKRDIDKGIMITPSKYVNGLMFKSSNGGEILNYPEWSIPELVNFGLDIYGLKKGSFYMISVEGRSSRKYNRLLDATDDRTLLVKTNLDELLIKYDFTDDIDSNKTLTSIFRANSAEMNLDFLMGKIYITNIIIEEVQLIEEDKNDEEEKDIILENYKKDIAAVAVFTLNEIVDTGRYRELERLTGRGLKLFYDSIENVYILERDNIEDTIGESFNNIRYFIDINMSKIVNNGLFDRYDIVEISLDVSPNTLKQGYVKFNFVKNDNVVQLNKDSRLVIIINKLF